MGNQKIQVKKSEKQRVSCAKNIYVEHWGVLMYYDTNQFHQFQYRGPHDKPHGARILGKYYNMRF